MSYEELRNKYQNYLAQISKPIPKKEKYFLACVIADLCEEMFGVESGATKGWRVCANNWKEESSS